MPLHHDCALVRYWQNSTLINFQPTASHFPRFLQIISHPPSENVLSFQSSNSLNYYHHSFQRGKLKHFRISLSLSTALIPERSTGGAIAWGIGLGDVLRYIVIYVPSYSFLLHYWTWNWRAWFWRKQNLKNQWRKNITVLHRMSAALSTKWNNFSHIVPWSYHSTPFLSDKEKNDDGSEADE